MQIIITGRSFEVSDAVRTQITTRIEDLLSHYPTLKISSVRVVIEAEKPHVVNVDLVAALKNHPLVAAASGSDVLKTADETLGKLETQIDRYVDKYKRPQPTPPTRDLAVVKEETGEAE